MSQFSHPTIPIRSQLRSHWVAGLAALLALLGTAAIVLVLAIDGGSSTTSSVSEQSQPAARPDNGPDESAVAASVGSRPSPGPSESAVAASLAKPQVQSTSTGSSESRVAGSINTGATTQSSSGPDESKVAASLSNEPSNAPQQSGPTPASGPR